MDNNKKYMLVNTMEMIVKDEVKDALRHVDMCKCEKCLLDIYAIVLNTVHPNYATTEKGSLINKASVSFSDNSMERKIEIAKAINTVRQAPMH